MVQDRRHGMTMCKTNSYAGTNGNGGCYSSFYLHITYENGFTVQSLCTSIFIAFMNCINV